MRPTPAVDEIAPVGEGAGAAADDSVLIELSGVTKVYGEGSGAVRALRGIDLRVGRGELVGIVGASGSGKSTAMNLIGCLDRPTTGTCRVAGRDVGALSLDERADLRNRVIGFVFQGFHLLARTTALENVELSLVYAGGGLSVRERRRRAVEVLERVGLGDRLHHTPSQLSGGQQQRVAIARALVTRPSLILADEPTGNLDSTTSEEIMELLEELNRDGMTVVVVTHESDIAARLDRRVEFRDGVIVGDSGPARRSERAPEGAGAERGALVGALAVLPVALRAIRRHVLRSFLTTLGIVIGVGAVVGMLAMGQGARAAIQAQIAAMGANLLNVRSGSSGRGGVRWGMGSLNTLTLEDADALARECASIDKVSPQVRTVAQVKAGGANWSTTVEGVGEHYLAIREWKVVSGEPLRPSDVRHGAKVCLVGRTVVQEVFGSGDPLGQVVRLNRIPFRVVGVLAERGESSWGQDQDDVVLAPLPAVQRRLMGVTHITGIVASAVSEERVERAKEEIEEVMRARHRLAADADDDFVVRTQSELSQRAGGMFATMTALLAGIAAVSLLVGGIGIMNIMLVSVTERTHEIGIRMAVGARGRDVMIQFLIEAVVLSGLGGVVGILLGVAVDRIISTLAGWPSGLTPGAMALALGFSAAVGVFFGLYPAREAAKLDPIDALRHE